MLFLDFFPEYFYELLQGTIHTSLNYFSQIFLKDASRNFSRICSRKSMSTLIIFFHNFLPSTSPLAICNNLHSITVLQKARAKCFVFGTPRNLFIFLVFSLSWIMFDPMALLHAPVERAMESGSNGDCENIFVFSGGWITNWCARSMLIITHIFIVATLHLCN